MKTASKEFKTQILTNRNFKYDISIMFDKGLSAGEKIQITDDDLMQDGCSIVSSAGTSSFPIGCAIGRTLTLTLNNSQDQWSAYHFYKAVIEVYVCADLTESQTLEKIYMGKYTVVEPETYGSTITITATDFMYKAGISYDTTKITHDENTTAYEIMKDACQQSGLLWPENFLNSSFILSTVPDEMTCREVIGCVAMLACGNAVVDDFGAIHVISYNKETCRAINLVDGGTFLTDTTPYSDGVDFDGGDFTYTNSDNLDGGSFGDRGDVHFFTKGLSLNVSTDDVIITGLQMSAKHATAKTDEYGNDSTEYTDVTILVGEEGYVLSLENKLFGESDEVITSALNLMSASIVGLAFRPFTLDNVSYPLADIGDLCVLYDRKNNAYQSIITDVDFAFKGITVLKCTADNPVRNASDYTSPAQQAIQKVHVELKKEITEREIAMAVFAEELRKSSGLYLSVVLDESGGSIFLLHDKREDPLPDGTFENSTIVWRLSAETMAVSTDGGKTYPFGFDAWGRAILDSIYVIGLNANYITTGKLKVGTMGADGDDIPGAIDIYENGNLIGKWDNNGIYVKKGTIEGTEIIGSNVITYKSNAYEGMATKSVNDGQDITVYKGNNADYKKCTSWTIVFQISQNERLHYGDGKYDTGIRIKAPAIGFQADSLYVSPNFSSTTGSKAMQGRKEIKMKYGDEEGGEDYHEVKLVFHNGILTSAY